MKRSMLFTFEVSGKGDFPYDMLRHDCCWPYSSDDAAMLSYSDRRTLRLQTGQMSSPTAARWASFGWAVTMAVQS